MKSWFSVRHAAGSLLLITSLLLLSACHTSHDIHITLDIRYIEANPGGAPTANTRALSAGENSMDPALLTPVMRTTMQHRDARRPLLDEWRGKGCVGENALGQVEARAEARTGLNAEQAANLEALLDNENRDRATLFAELARARGLSGDAAREVPLFWAEELRAGLKPGAWFQVPSQERFHQRFANSALSKRFTKLPAAGAWVQMP